MSLWGDAIDRKAAEDLVARLVDMGVLDERDAACVRAAVFDQEDTEAPELEGSYEPEYFAPFSC